MIATIGGGSWDEFRAQALSAISDAGVRAVIVQSGRREYPGDVASVGKVLRQIETSGKPFVAVMEGSTSPADLEIALACQ